MQRHSQNGWQVTIDFKMGLEGKNCGVQLNSIKILERCQQNSRMKSNHKHGYDTAKEPQIWLQHGEANFFPVLSSQ